MGKAFKALDNLYHPECFNCNVCNVKLSGSFYDLNGQPVCEPCKQNADNGVSSAAAAYVQERMHA